MRSVSPWQASAVLNRSPKGRSYGFDFSLNPYRGCSHGCRYCYARESHTYLNLDVGLDFEQQLFVKDNLPERLAAELKRLPEDAVIAIGTATDPYQPLEGRHRLTRTAIELLAGSGHPFTITTKSPLIERDLDILAPLGQRRQAGVHISLISLDARMIRRLEPGTSPPSRRTETVRRLHDAGIPVGVFAAPIVPGLTDDEDTLDALFSAVGSAGADWIMTSPPRLSPAIREYFFGEVARFNPEAAQALRRLYGPTQYVDPAYRSRLTAQLDRLYRRYRVGRTAPTLAPFVRKSQITFAFD